ncbi:MAG: MATE family efflux transporter, partial [Bacillota bacterium]
MYSIILLSRLRKIYRLDYLNSFFYYKILHFAFGVYGILGGLAFVAQYTGAKASARVGAALWQGIYFALGSAVLLAALVFAAGPIFDLIGHSPHIRKLEVEYFSILTLGAGLVVLGAAMASF